MTNYLRHVPVLGLCALLLGVIADQLFYGRLPGISVPLMVLLCLLALEVLSRLERLPGARANRWLGPTALLFAILTAVRAEPWLVFVNGCAALGLLILQVGLFRGVSLARLPLLELVLRSLVSMAETAVRPFGALFGMFRWLRPQRISPGKAMPVLRGLLIALPILAVFTALLASADSIFASYVEQLFNFRWPEISVDLLLHSALIGIVAWLSAGALLTALRAEQEPEREEPRQGAGWLGIVEALTVLGLVTLLFAVFMLIQAAYLFGGLETLTRTGMTYADYARRGFFELVAVACLAIGLLWAAAAITKRGDGWQIPTFNAVCTLLIVLVVGLLGSAFQRMWLYEQGYGFTHLRVYTHVFMLWLAILLLLFLAALLAARPQFFTTGGLVSALVVLAILTLANPEAMIVQANVARFQQTGQLGVQSDSDTIDRGYGDYRPSQELDASFLARLSTDATPTLVALLPSLSQEAQAQIRDGLAQQHAWLNETANESGWPGWHFSRMQALQALSK